MARKTKVITITDEGRDRGKVFLLTEMPARLGERWAARALLAAARADVNLPDGIAGAGMAGLAMLGLRAVSRMEFSEAEPLLDEMMRCVTVMPDPAKNPSFTRPLVDNGTDGDDIEEVATRLHLRSELFMLHTGFFLTDEKST